MLLLSLQLAAGIIAICQMLSAMVVKTAEAAGNAIQSYADERIRSTPPSRETLSLLSPTVTTRWGVESRGGIVIAKPPSNTGAPV
jgi:hypothetical protein